MSRESWLAAHPYLRPVADFSAQVDRALALEVPEVKVPEFERYHVDYLAGVPLLTSGHVDVSLEPGARLALTLVERLVPVVANEYLSRELRALFDHLHRTPDHQRHIVDLLLGDEFPGSPSPGLLRYLGWTAMARYLRPVLIAFEKYRNDEQWHRGYCPGCGSWPSMAQLVGVDHGRKRLLSCGCCGMRWQFRRTACPFCEADSQSIATVKIDREPALRIDHCTSCCAYLKTYAGEGEETTMLADWSSLHLDMVALERGLKRRAASLYDLEPVSLPQ